MKLLRYGAPGQEKPGLLDAGGSIRDLSEVVDDIAGHTLEPGALSRLAALNPAELPLVPAGARLGPCVGRVGKFICIGLNFSDHAAESNLPVPAEPVVFGKWTSAIVGPNDDIEIPRGARKTDWEVELGVVIGRHGRYISESDALSHVAGYCVVMTCRSVSSSSSAAARGTRAKAATLSVPSGRGSPRRMRSPIRTHWPCGWKWMASAIRTAAART